MKKNHEVNYQRLYLAVVMTFALAACQNSNQ